VQAVARPRQRDGLAPPGGDHAVEAQLQQAQQLADHGRRAGLRGGEVAVLVAQQQEAAVGLEALGGQAQRLLHERLRVEALQGEVADAEQHVDAGLPAVQLLAVNAETRKRSSDELSSTASTRSAEAQVMVSFPWLTCSRPSGSRTPSTGASARRRSGT